MKLKPLCCLFTCCFLIFANNPSNGTQSTLNLKGVHLNVAVSQNPPWDVIVRSSNNGTVTYSGTTRETIDWLSTKLKFKCTFVYASEEEERKFGAKNAGLNLIIRKEADLTAFSNSNTPDRRRVMDFTRFVSWQDEFRMITPKPGEEDRLFAFIRPFYPMVWLILGLSFIATIYVMSVSNTLIAEKSFKIRKQKNFVELLVLYSMYLINTLSNHGDYLLHELSIASFFIVTFFWLLGASVLVYGYSSIIVSSLTAPSTKASINTYEDLVGNSEVRLLLSTEFSWTQSILRGENEIYKKLAVKASKHPESITSSIETRDKLLSTGKYAFFHLETFCRSYIANDYKKEKKCRFELSDPLRQPSYPFYFMAVVKDSPYNDAISLGLMQLYETGILRYLTYGPMPKAEECFSKNQRTNQNSRTLNLEDFAGAFLILSIGLTFSLIVFFIQIFFYYLVKRRA